MRLWLLAKILLHPLRFVQDRIDAWVMRRVKRLPGPIVITRNRVYILPTRFGYAFAAMALVMLMGSMNYSNSMGFMLTFLLGGLGLVCMHYTHGNLAFVQLRPGRAKPVFAGEIAHFEVQVENPAPRPRYSLALAWPRDTSPVLAADVEGENAALMRIALPAAQRGWLKASVFSVSTEFPLGLFHAWTWAELDMACLVYPKPAPPGRLPPPASGASGLHSSGKSGQDEFAGLRAYQRGDALKSIHWKSLPKLQAPMIKQFTELLDLEFWLDWALLPDLDTEARLSQLTRWALDAELQGRNYGLRLPGLTIAPHHGEHHQQECLKALALYGQA
ncbi:MAG TPA: DUF58 domain-containing protein [Solimonas sp.]|nr:DUF58 domain-containing protein [Solimonas sp.]